MNKIRNLVITGGSGFIGTNLIEIALKKNLRVLNIDRLNYCSNSRKFNHRNYLFKKLDLTNGKKLNIVLKKFKPDAIINCAAESHVDRSINNPGIFVHSNIFSILNILNFVKNYSKKIKLIHVSTDEVFGSLKNNKNKFDLKSKYDPKSPYSASKASSDFFVRSFGNTYNIDYVITNCSNNYGPYQYTEKLIPVVILSCIKKKKIPIYGNGRNIREWIFVKDHCEALIKILYKKRTKDTYLIGSNNEFSNVKIINFICEWFNENIDKTYNYKALKKFVVDRKGHDFRYALDYSQTSKDLNWFPRSNFNETLILTIKFYLENFSKLKNIFPYEKKNSYPWK